LFLVTPQPSSARGLAMPFSLGGGIGAASAGGIVNPGFTAGETGRSSAASYHGFSNSLDLRVRGDLSDDLVMRVRASAPAMWKGMIFDNYSGVTWTGEGEEATPLGGAPPYAYPPAFRSLGPRATVTQTFYVEVEQPNVVFAAGQPDNVWIEGGVAVDDLGGLRTPATLTPGAVYSVVSTRGAAGRAELRRATGELPDRLGRYLQLPAALPPRVGELARRITAGASNDLDRVLAIESYLRSNFRYSIDSPVPPPGRDAVDHFLFDAKVGFCEQFASATAVMLRTLGIPARVVAGYAVGRRNPFTGLYEVRASDAHSWVEVWFPGGLGWYEFDPTFDVPPARADVSQTLPLASVARALSGLLPSLRVPAATRGVLLTGAAATGALFVITWLRRRRSRREEVGGAADAGAVGPVTRSFLRLEGALARAGTVRAPGETARELLGRSLGADAPRNGLAVFERERYGATPPPSADGHRAADELDRAALRVEEEITR
ncbi:MAG TPA: transglutaminase domain-containing protein, partial [Actinomycetota bacterium]|nr:transglutaminase domain-containing protein [Actinomycetota bacterium]